MQPSEKGGENNPEAFSLSKHSGQALGQQTPAGCRPRGQDALTGKINPRTRTPLQKTRRAL